MAGAIMLTAPLGAMIFLGLSTNKTTVLHLEMTLGTSLPSKAQVFWSGAEAEFAAGQEADCDVMPGAASYEVAVPVDPGRLRIDPLSQPGSIEIRSIRLTRWGLPLRSWDSREGFGDWSPLNHLADFAVVGGMLHMRSIGLDPAFATGTRVGLGAKRCLVDGAISLMGWFSLAALLLAVPGVRRGAVQTLLKLLVGWGGVLPKGLLVRSTRFVAESLAILVLGACLTEVAMRVYQHFVPVFIFPSEGTNRFRGQPFAPDYKDGLPLNSHGFKDVEFEKQKRPGTVRILGLGDSFAFGVVPYQYNYLTLLEQDLGRVSPAAEVINMGIPSTGPSAYLEVLVNEGLPLNADMVLVSVFVGNDFTDEDLPPPRSYLLAFGRYLLMPKPKGVPLHGNDAYHDDGYSFEADKYLEIERLRSAIFRRSNVAFSAQADSVRSDLERMKLVCRNKGLELLVVVIPDEMQVSPELQGQVVASYPGAAADFDFAKANRRLGSDLQALGIRYLDLLGPFQEAGRTQRLYRLRDTHWNIAGNRLAADLIRDELLRGDTKFWPRPRG